MKILDYTPKNAEEHLIVSPHLSLRHMLFQMWKVSPPGRFFFSHSGSWLPGVGVPSTWSLGAIDRNVNVSLYQKYPKSLRRNVEHLETSWIRRDWSGTFWNHLEQFEPKEP